LEPDEDLLLFIADYHRSLPEWKRDILRIVAAESRYFVPQIETKIMNEGWASYWHHKIMNELDLPQKLHLEFLVRHNQVLRPHPGGLNPYHLGFVMWHDIERRWNSGEIGHEYNTKDPEKQKENQAENETPGRKKIFEVRESDRDTSFLRRFLTEDLIREHNLFQHDKRGKDRVVTKVADSDNWKDIKETLIKNTGMNAIPVIKVEDADYSNNQTLYLKHYHDNRDLLLEYAEPTLRHIQRLWGRNVILESSINGKSCRLCYDGNEYKLEKI